MSVTRQLVLGIDPYTGITTTFAWAIAADLNDEGNVLSCAIAPKAEANVTTLLQESWFMGTHAAGKTLHTFLFGISLDDGENIIAEAITNRIDPDFARGASPDERARSGVPGAKRFLKIEFPNQNPLESGWTVQFSKETPDAFFASPVWEDFDWTPGKARAQIPSCVAKWIQLRIYDDTPETGFAGFGSFIVHYYSLFSRDQGSVT